jgi:hypothetical protein
MDEHQQYYVSYSWPSCASVVYKNQFVLLKARSRWVSLSDIAAVLDLVDETERIDVNIGRNLEDFSLEPQFLMLRGIYFDDAHGGEVIHVELLHDSSVAPSWNEAQLRAALRHESSDDGVFRFVEATITPVSLSSDHFFPVADGFYERVREALGWR